MDHAITEQNPLNQRGQPMKSTCTTKQITTTTHTITLTMDDKERIETRRALSNGVGALYIKSTKTPPSATAERDTIEQHMDVLATLYDLLANTDTSKARHNTDPDTDKYEPQDNCGDPNLPTTQRQRPKQHHNPHSINTDESTTKISPNHNYNPDHTKTQD